VVLWAPKNGVPLAHVAAKRGWPELAPGVFLDPATQTAYTDIVALVGTLV
jgi:hypothetical protein